MKRVKASFQPKNQFVDMLLSRGEYEAREGEFPAQKSIC